MLREEWAPSLSFAPHLLLGIKLQESGGQGEQGWGSPGLCSARGQLSLLPGLSGLCGSARAALPPALARPCAPLPVLL